MVVEIPPPKKFGGSEAIFVKYSADGGSFAYYPSGNMACAYERMGAGFYCYFYEDKDLKAKPLTLVSFDPFGEGYVLFADGRSRGNTRLSSTKTGGTFNREDGSNEYLWTVSKPLRKPVEIDVTQNIHISFESRQRIKAKLSVSGMTEEYELGAVEKMATDSYLSKAVRQIKHGPERGKYVLDVDKCRQAAQENRERRQATAMTDLGPAEVHITEDFMQKHKDLRPIVKSTHDLTQSVERGEWDVDVFVSKEEMIRTMPLLSLGSSLKTNPHSNTIASLPTSTPDVYSALVASSNNDTGALPLSAAIKGASGRYRPDHGKRKETDRERLTEIKSKTYDEQIADVPKDVLVCVCCLGSYMKGYDRQKAVYEKLNGELVRAERVAEAGAGGGGGGGADAELAGFRLMKYEMSESKLLQTRHNFTTVPMFLMYYGGKLAYAKSTLNGYGTSAEDMKAQMRATKASAQAGQLLDANFKFSATSDNMMDNFSATLSGTSSFQR